jgi:hypothetical protein
MIFESNGVATDLYPVSEELVRTLPSEGCPFFWKGGEPGIRIESKVERTANC